MITFFMYFYLFLFSDNAFTPDSPENGGTQAPGATESTLMEPPPPSKIKETVVAD